MPDTQKITKLDIATWGGFIIFAVSGTIVAVSLPEISATFNTNLSEGGGLEFVRNLLILGILLLAGILAQQWGKKRFLAFGQYLLAFGLLMASLAPNYQALLLALILMGAGGGFSEALINPLIVDIHKEKSGRFLNLSHGFFPLGVMGSALIFGELLTLGYSWRLLFQIGAVGSLIVALAYTILHFPAAARDNTPYPQLFSKILSLSGFWLFTAAIMLGGAIEASLAFWSRTYVGEYLSAVPRAGAIAVALFSAAMVFGRFLAAYLSGKVSLNLIMLVSAVLGLVVSFFLPQTTSLLGYYALVTLAGLAIACFWPTILAEADASLRVNTTILFVLLSAMGIIGYGFTPFVLGIIGDSAGLRAGFALIPLLYILLIAVLLLERRRSLRALKNRPTGQIIQPTKLPD